MQRTLRAALTAAVMMAASTSAFAQATPWEDRVYLNLSFGQDTGSVDVSGTSSFSVYNETGTLQAEGEFGSFGIIDVGAGVRVFGNIGVGLAYHSGDTTGKGLYTATVPHPLFFDRPRTVTGTFDDARREESATHLQFGYMLPLGEKFDVFISGGPSFYNISQELVTNLSFVEQGPPYTSITVLPTVETVKESATGYNFGVDASYFVYSTDTFRLGVGGFLRFTGATADLNVNGQTVETDLGGTQFAIGARLRF